jgi:hypothetical protein
LVHLTKLGREAPELPCTACLEEVQWRVLVAVVRRETGAPEQPPTLQQQVVRMVASLGGFLGRKDNGQPRVRCLWRRWQRLEALAIGWQMARATLKHRSIVFRDRRYG